MGCFSSKKEEEDKKPHHAHPARKKHLKGLANNASGYTISEFVNDHLVPVKAFVYKKDFWNNPQGQTSQLHADLAKICYVVLDETEINTDTKNTTKIDKAFDFNQETMLPIYVKGILHFPPEIPPEEKSVKGKEAITDPNRMRLAVRVEAQLLKAEREIDVETSKERPGDDLTVKCIALDIATSADKDGDPMVDSWLPRQDVLLGIQRLLDAKLKEALRGQGT
mmetsp:Transcript_10480/g.23805  ORF Transcript_10480/g.23805 Transcript_10480/m.23805 type:complete len:223 (+) Transcript_10480:37-705(+)